MDTVIWLLGLIGVHDFEFWRNPHWWASLGGVIWVDILLSGDNALIIGMVAAGLPAGQQRAAILLGTLAAIGLRIVASLAMTLLLTVSWIGIAGAVLLVYIAVKMVLDNSHDERPPATSLGRAVLMIVAADITMSIDNMMAIAGLAHGDATLVAIGLIVSIALIIVGATLISRIIARYPKITWVGAAFLGWIAGGIVVTDPAARAYLEGYSEGLVHYAAAGIGALLVIAIAGAIVLSRPPSFEDEDEGDAALRAYRAGRP